MDNVREIISHNIVLLRKNNRLTQLELAEKLNYSDKAISRWERGDTLPDIDTLCSICELFGVDFDFLIHVHDEKKITNELKKNAGNKLTITLLVISLVWFLATIVYVYSGIITKVYVWKVFVWAVPFSALVGLVFNSVWGRKSNSFIIASIFVWSLLASFYVEFINYKVWLIFILGL